ncbi:MFS transporter [Rhodococcoides trifolii]|uniref:MFS transporter n=1 Tax=Rhodococcoides trifolii TaxID=908250 RepID=A0A917G566_9NOCA|nr:MFS transporter [Rhodococcus trifolii]GGG23450.1 MFS transporter [Rhodococcus trifolii]
MQPRNARIGVSLLFFTNGALFANLVPRYPAIKAELGLTNTIYGVALAMFPLGALVSGLAAGLLVRRYRSSRVAVAGTIVTGIGVVAAGVSPTWVTLAASLFLAGAADSITDVAQNAHGLRVQRAYGRSILNSFHAVWSIGAVTGGVMGGAAAGFDIPLGIHLGTSTVLMSLIAVGCYFLMLPGPEPLSKTGELPTQSSVGPKVAVLSALVVIAVCGALVEDAGSSWAAVYLNGDLGAIPAVAALGFVALVGAQTVGRLLGDRLVDRFGQRAVARAGGTIAAVGMGAALAFPSVPGTIVGFAAAGFGVATLVPAAMSGADDLPGLRHGTGLAVVSWLMRIGFLVSPPIVGLVADTAGLRVGLIVVPLAGVLVVVLARALAGHAK